MQNARPGDWGPRHQHHAMGCASLNYITCLVIAAVLAGCPAAAESPPPPPPPLAPTPPPVHTAPQIPMYPPPSPPVPSPPPIPPLSPQIVSPPSPSPPPTFPSPPPLPSTLPSLVNWTSRMTPVSDVGKCPLLWAAAAVTVVEAALAIAYPFSKPTRFSAQALASCMNSQTSPYYPNADCKSSIRRADAFTFMANFTIPMASDYPFFCGPSCRPCDTNMLNLSDTSDNWIRLRTDLTYRAISYTEVNLMKEVAKQPVMFFLDLTVANRYSFSTWRGGAVYEGEGCDGDIKSSLAMVLVGYNADERYWIVQLSSGTDWGDRGYARIRMAGTVYGLCNMYKNVVALRRGAGAFQRIPNFIRATAPAPLNVGVPQMPVYPPNSPPPPPPGASPPPRSQPPVPPPAPRLPPLPPDAPSYINWAAAGKVTAVKQIGSKCKCTWAAAAVTVVEAALAIAYPFSKPTRLSFQALVSCMNNATDAFYASDAGCASGSYEHAFKFMSSFTIPMDRYYSYSSVGGNTGPCWRYMLHLNTTSDNWIQLASGIGYRLPNSLMESDIMAVVAQHPILTNWALSDSWRNYTGGIYEASDCDGQPIMAVVVVGYNATGRYWIVQNSWGKDWGQSGFAQVRMTGSASGPCGMYKDMFEVQSVPSAFQHVPTFISSSDPSPPPPSPPPPAPSLPALSTAAAAPPPDSGTNVAAIVVPVVVGTLLLVSAVAGFLWWRKRREEAAATKLDPLLPVTGVPGVDGPSPNGDGRSPGNRLLPNGDPDSAYNGDNTQSRPEPLDITWLHKAMEKLIEPDSYPMDTNSDGVIGPDSGTSSGGRNPMDGIQLQGPLQGMPIRPDVNLDLQTKDVMLDENQILGRGAFGVVFKGTYQDTPVAVKVMPGTSLQNLHGFRYEMSILARLDHPNIVLLNGASMRPGQVFLVMELMHQSLAAVIKAATPDTLPMNRVFEIAESILEALVYMHTLDVVHRDLKPANILLDTWGKAKISDFGLARGKFESYITGTKIEAGTVAYMPPECFTEDNGKIGAKFDIYSFGVILWEMLSLELPWEGMNHVQIITQTAVLKHHLDIPENSGRFTPKLTELLKACWANQSSDRPTSMELQQLLLAAKEDF